MIEEIMLLLKDLKEPVLEILEEANKPSLLDYLPHIISALAVITSMIIVIIQYRQGIALQQKAEIYRTKKEAILEALSFLDTYISWLDVIGYGAPLREETNDVMLTAKARTIHNKLCISCDNAEIVKLFVDIVLPAETNKEGYPVFEKYNEFRNACRKELGYKTVGLPMDKIYLSQVSTSALQNQNNRNSSSNS